MPNTRRTRRPLLRPAPDCSLVRNLGTAETAILTDMTAAVRHLRRAVARSTGPHTEIRQSAGRPDLARHAADILAAAALTRTALNELTEPYSTGSVLTGETSTSRASYTELRAMADTLLRAHAAGTETAENLADSGAELARIVPQLLDHLDRLEAARTSETPAA